VNIVLLGPPGSGKGTQAEHLEASLNIAYIASGDIFRAISRDETSLGRQVRSYLDQGQYVPDELTIKLIVWRLRQIDARRGFLLDGFPRTEAQAEALDAALKQRGAKVDAVVYITAPDEVLIGRICSRLSCRYCNAIFNTLTKPPRDGLICDECGHTLEYRADQAPNVVRTRLQAYRDATVPLVEYYRKRTRVLEVDGTQAIDEVTADIDAALDLPPARNTA
jgi:adenylate kinase